jgi:hypothetical protein
MPDSTEMPAPVRARVYLDARIISAAFSKDSVMIKGLVGILNEHPVGFRWAR